MLEEDAFWAWAIVETLRHTGTRIEELLEFTQLSLRHYTALRRRRSCNVGRSPTNRRKPGAEFDRAG